MPRRTAVVLAGAAALAAVAVPAAARPWPEPEPVVPAVRQDQLTITVTGAGTEDDTGTADGEAAADGGDRLTYTLDCRPAGGSHPDPLAACDAIDRASRERGNPWKPVSEDAMCPQIYGGTATAHVTGFWRGERVDAVFNRTDGCEIARWDALVPALPAQGT